MKTENEMREDYLLAVAKLHKDTNNVWNDFDIWKLAVASTKTTYTERDSLISMQDARIEELEGMVAFQADALKTCKTVVYPICSGESEAVVQSYDKDAVYYAISATAETVQAFRATSKKGGAL